MFSMPHVVRILENCGMIHLIGCKSDRRNLVQNVYVSLNKYMFSLFVLCHSFNVFTRAIRYHSEFVERLVENGLIFLFLFVIIYFHKYPQTLETVCTGMETFSKADSLIVQKCDRQAKQCCLAFVTVALMAVSCSMLESIFPISNDELIIRQRIYQTKYPERRHIYNIRIPFIDESESWAYEILYVYGLYIAIYFAIGIGSVTCLIPLIMIHVRGQYEMLSKYVSMIGQQHRDSFGCRIFYTNIETRAYVSEADTPLILKSTGNRIHSLLKAKLKRQNIYEANYLRQVMRFHQKLLVFQDKLTQNISTIITSIVCSCNIFIVLCLYQLVVHSTDISLLRYVKLLVMFVGIMAGFFFVCCNSSEVVDDCSRMMETAIKQCNWEKCNNETRRDLCVILRRVQRPNHLTFNQGVLVLSRPLFLKVGKLAYSFFNFMRVKTVK